MSISYPTTDGARHEDYVGAVLSTGEHNHYHDSYFYALVWDGTKVAEVEYASTAYSGGGSATVDATPDVLAAAAQWRLEGWVYYAVMEAHRERLLPTVGRTVRSTTTRGKNKGVVGVVGWVGPNSYSRDPEATRLRVQTADGEQRWLDGDRVEVVEPGPIDLAAILRHAAA